MTEDWTREEIEAGVQAMLAVFNEAEGELSQFEVAEQDRAAVRAVFAVVCGRDAHNRQARSDALVSTQLEVDVLKAALGEILYTQRADDARKIAERVLGK